MKRVAGFVAGAAAVAVAVLLWLQWRGQPPGPKPPALLPASRVADAPFASVTFLAFSPDGTRLYLASRDGGVASFVPATGEPGEMVRAGSGWTGEGAMKARGELVELRRAVAAVSGPSQPGAMLLPLIVLGRFTLADWVQTANSEHIAWTGLSPDGLRQVIATRIEFTGPVYSETQHDLSYALHSFSAEGVRSGWYSERANEPHVRRVEFSATGKGCLIAREGGPVRAAPSLRTLFSHEPGPILEGAEKLGWVSVGDAVAAGGMSTIEVGIWDLATGKLLHRVRHPGAANGVLCDGGKRLVTASEGSVRVWDTATGREIGEAITGPTGPNKPLAVSAGGTRMLLGEVLRELPSGERIGTLDTGDASKVALSADGKRAAALVGTKIRIWDLE